MFACQIVAVSAVADASYPSPPSSFGTRVCVSQAAMAAHSSGVGERGGQPPAVTCGSQWVDTEGEFARESGVGNLRAAPLYALDITGMPKP